MNVAIVWQARPHTGHDLLGDQLEVEGAPVGQAAIDGNLLERLNEVAGAFEIRDELVRSVATGVGELGELGAAYLAGGDLVGEVRAAVRERRGHRQAGADRGIDLVRNARDQTAERS